MHLARSVVIVVNKLILQMLVRDATLSFTTFDGLHN